MDLEFLKLKRENIFCADYYNLSKNNVINLDKNISVLYAPNGVGKSSFCKVLNGNGEFELKYNSKNYTNKNCDLFHIIFDQNNRNIIKGNAKDFLLGDNIVKEFELRDFIFEKFDDIYYELKKCFKSKMNLSKVKDNRLLWFKSEYQIIIREIINSKGKSENIDLNNYISMVNSIGKIKIDEYDINKFNYILDENNYQIIVNVSNLKDVKEVKRFLKYFEYDDALNILEKYKDSDLCIVCDSEMIYEELLQKKKNQKKEIVDNLSDDTKLILENIINKITSEDPFEIKETLKEVISNGDVDKLNILIIEIKKYIDLYVNSILKQISESLSDEFISKYKEYLRIIEKPPIFSDDDIMFIEEFIEKNINKKLTLDRIENKISIKINSDDLLEVDRNEMKLSTGEQNFISLTFEFLKAKNCNKEIIVIDDPISSFDSIFKNKLVYAIAKFLEIKKCIILTHNMDLVKLINFQKKNNFNLYLFNNHIGQENGFINVNTNELDIMISIPKLLDLIRSGDINENIIDEKLYVYSLIPFMRGYVNFIGDKLSKEELTILMHGYNSKKVNLSNIYSKLFNNSLNNNYLISVSDILNIDIANLPNILDNNVYPILNKVLRNNLTYLFLRLKVENELVNKFGINTKKYDQLDSIINKSFKNDTNENRKNRIFFFSKKTLLNEFNHFEGNLNIFQPALDISEEILERETVDILDKLKKI